MIRLKNGRESKILDTIQSNPGIQFREIMRHSGLKNGVLSHYLGKLEKKGSVKVERNPRQTIFYPVDITDEQAKIAKSLRRDTPRKIIHSLMLQDGLEFGQIVRMASRSPSTVSLYLSQLVDENIIHTTLGFGRKKYYHLTDKPTVDKMIEDHRPGLLERPVSGFEDIIGSL
ncbi:MAG: winged helix-turn-helix transcriptional regulator [Nitrosopumilus sp.]|nr:winged helix-turn-helix transcriptional regulator [Nitrosopumilus sp.]